MLICMIRSVILYILLIAAIRLMGKRQIGELEPSEFVIAMLLADLASVPMQDLGIPLLAGVIPILTVLAIEILLSVLSYYSIGIRKLLCGTPVLLMINGKIIQENMKKTRVTSDELMEQLRENGIINLATVKYAILETNGQINAFTYDRQEPVSKSDLNIPADDTSLPITLISNGKILYEKLRESPYTEKKLLRIIQEQGLKQQDIFLLTSDQCGTLYIARK